jgi:hypothetical protein
LPNWLGLSGGEWELRKSICKSLGCDLANDANRG